MAHQHHPHHGGHHSALAGSLDGAFLLGAALNIVFIGVEVAYGIASNSVALLADAGHNLGDMLGLLVAWGGSVLARRQPTPRFTYGLRSTSILAALFNAIVLLITVGGIAVEAVRRLYAPEPIAGETVVIVAAIGIAVNGATALLFRRNSQRDINVRAAFLHMLSDALVSFGVVLGGVGLALTGKLWIDSATSLLVAVFLVVSTWRLLRQSIAMALQAVPSDIEPEDVRDYLGNVAGVTQVHDLHIWHMSTTERALTCHLVMPEGHPGDAALTVLARELHERFDIGHVTIQVEAGDPAHLCKLVSDHVA